MTNEPTSTPEFTLQRNSFGRLVFVGTDGEAQKVVPVRAFPITAPNEGVALVGGHGQELAWIEHLDTLPAGLRELVEVELASREFMPLIERIVAVSSFATPSTWTVQTDRGETKLVLKGEEDIRRLAPPALLITGNDGIQYLIRDREALDSGSRKILDRFL